MPEQFVSTDDFCRHYEVEYSFISSLKEHGLIEVRIIDEHSFIDHDHLKKVEQLIRMHYDLDINVEGIEAIGFLLNKVKSLQEEIISLKNKLELCQKDGPKLSESD